jgi:eukaryotic-like serine/threonine-protein kinase
VSDPIRGSRSQLGGRFTLESELGSGGMATVYLGRDQVLDRPVAVKVLKHGFDEDIAERFQREGRTAARLSHPNVVQVFDAGEAELDGRDAPYIVMEHVPGGDLKSLIDSEGHLGSERVARLGAGISAGLAHAHERGVIHRDIKPHNILLDESGSPKLTDFGIARALDATAMTVSGVYLGTALYSSPEQLKGEGTTPKSDIYSLGAALYQAATGQPPFSGSPLEVANQHTLREPEAPGSRRDSGAPDPKLDALILACLAKDPADRPTAAETRDRLDEISAARQDGASGVADAPSGGSPAASVRGGARRRRPVLRTFAGAAVLVLLLVVGAAFAMMDGGELQSPGSGSGGEQSPTPEDPGGQEASGGADQGSAANETPEASGGAELSVVASRQTDGGSEDSEPQRAPNESGVGATGESEAAAQTVRDVYQLAAAEDYGASYGLLSSDFRQREAGSRQNWAGSFTTLESISFVEGPTASVSGDTAQVTGTTRAVHTDRTEFNRGTWTLVRENGEWRLDDLSIQKL